VLTRHPSLRVTPAQALALLDGTFKHRAALSSAAARPTTASSPRPGVEREGERGALNYATHITEMGARAARAGLPLLTVT
jgi:hypothetical protein